MITKKTFAAMIVPSIAPTSMYAARAASSCEGLNKATTINASTTSARSRSSPPKNRQARSYTSHATTSPATEIVIASQLDRAATERSTRYVCGWMKYTTTNSAKPESQVV